MSHFKKYNNMEGNEEVYLIDSHCHLQYFNMEEIKGIVEKCNTNRIKYLLTNATCMQDFDYTIEISKINNTDSDKVIIPGVGYHPWYLDDCVKDNSTWYEDMTQYINKLEVGGCNYFIGEIGIDGGRPKK
jgi:Tat protein secretion system quality control protein TatD with DNase activity